MSELNKFLASRVATAFLRLGQSLYTDVARIDHWSVRHDMGQLHPVKYLTAPVLGSSKYCSHCRHPTPNSSTSPSPHARRKKAHHHPDQLLTTLSLSHPPNSLLRQSRKPCPPRLVCRKPPTPSPELRHRGEGRKKEKKLEAFSALARSRPEDIIINLFTHRKDGPTRRGRR